MRKILYIIIILVGVLALIQLIPYGRDHANPPVVKEPNWDSPSTRDLVKIACFDCHSNQTVWPWYSKIAPVSWLVYRDVIEGRQRMNFSDWGSRSQSTGEIVGIIQEGEMPPFQYTLIHRNAILDTTMKQQLIIGIEATLK